MRRRRTQCHAVVARTIAYISVLARVTTTLINVTPILEPEVTYMRHHPFAAAWACREWRAACSPGTDKSLGRHSSQPINYGLVKAVQEQYSGRVSHWTTAPSAS